MQGVRLQFLNIKAWMLALTLAAGWVSTRPGSRLPIRVNGWRSSAPVMLVFAFSSNFVYAWLGSLLRQWLSQGSRLLWFNRALALVLAATAGLDAHGMKITQESKGMWLGLRGVAIFALTLPMTRLAMGTPERAADVALCSSLGRAAVAGVLSAVFLLATRAPLPRRARLDAAGHHLGRRGVRLSLAAGLMRHAVGRGHATPA